MKKKKKGDTTKKKQKQNIKVCQLLATGWWISPGTCTQMFSIN